MVGNTEQLFEYSVRVDSPTEEEVYTVTVQGIGDFTTDTMLVIKGHKGAFASFPLSRVVQFGREPIESAG